jgi:hypothetical protein
VNFIRKSYCKTLKKNIREEARPSQTSESRVALQTRSRSYGPGGSSMPDDTSPSQTHSEGSDELQTSADMLTNTRYEGSSESEIQKYIVAKAAAFYRIYESVHSSLKSSIQQKKSWKAWKLLHEKFRARDMSTILALRFRLEILKIDDDKENGYNQVLIYFDKINQIQQERFKLDKN